MYILTVIMYVLVLKTEKEQTEWYLGDFWVQHSWQKSRVVHQDILYFTQSAASQAYGKCLFYLKKKKKIDAKDSYISLMPLLILWH